MGRRDVDVRAAPVRRLRSVRAPRFAGLLLLAACDGSQVLHDLTFSTPQCFGLDNLAVVRVEPGGREVTLRWSGDPRRGEDDDALPWEELVFAAGDEQYVVTDRGASVGEVVVDGELFPSDGPFEAVRIRFGEGVSFGPGAPFEETHRWNDLPPSGDLDAEPAELPDHGPVCDAEATLFDVALVHLLHEEALWAAVPLREGHPRRLLVHGSTAMRTVSPAQLRADLGPGLRERVAPLVDRLTSGGVRPLELDWAPRDGVERCRIEEHLSIGGIGDYGPSVCHLVFEPSVTSDGTRALLRARVGPTPHGASVTVLLQRCNAGGWEVLWAKVAVYA